MIVLSRAWWFVSVWLLAAGVSGLQAQTPEPKSPSLGDLFNKVKDIKVPESISGLPQQLNDLRDAYLKTSATVEELKKEVAGLHEEVASLRAANQRLESALAERQDLAASGQTAAVEVVASELGQAFAKDRATALQRYQGRYLKVWGAVEKFEAVSSDIEIHLRVEGTQRTVCCTVRRDSNFHVDVAPTKDRLVSRVDRSSLITVGQPVTILGTLDGADLNIRLTNCAVEGVSAKAPVQAR